MVDGIFSALTWPWVLLSLAAALAGAWWPNRKRPAARYGVGSAAVAAMLAADLWGEALYLNAWAVFLFPFFIGFEGTAIMGAFWVGGKWGRFLSRAGEGGSRSTAAPRETGFGVIAAIVLLAVVCTMIGPLIADRGWLTEFAVWLAIPSALALVCSYSLLASLTTWAKWAAGIPALAVLLFLLAAGPVWHEYIQLEGAVSAAPLPARAMQLEPVSVHATVGDDCERYATAEWQVWASLNEVVAFYETSLRQEGWTGEWRNGNVTVAIEIARHFHELPFIGRYRPGTWEASTSYFKEGLFSRHEHVGHLKVQIVHEPAVLAISNELLAGKSERDAVDAVASQFLTDDAVNIIITLRATSADRSSCPEAETLQ